MRAIVPAAGQGRRLMPHTARLPKCLVPVGGVPVIDRLMSQLLDTRVNEVILVVGHEADLLKEHVERLTSRPPVRFLRNPEFAETNSIVSVAATAGHWDEDFVLIDSDLLVSGHLLRRVINVPGNAMAVDTGRRAEEIDMAVDLRDGVVRNLAKGMAAERISGESVPLSRWSVAGASQLATVMRNMVRQGETQVWYQYAIRKVAPQVRITPVRAHPTEWIEIDNGKDLENANAMFARRTEA